MFVCFYDFKLFFRWINNTKHYLKRPWAMSRAASTQHKLLPSFSPPSLSENEPFDAPDSCLGADSTRWKPTKMKSILQFRFEKLQISWLFKTFYFFIFLCCSLLIFGVAKHYFVVFAGARNHVLFLSPLLVQKKKKSCEMCVARREWAKLSMISLQICVWLHIISLSLASSQVQQTSESRETSRHKKQCGEQPPR